MSAVAGCIAVVALLGIGVVHGIWARGIWWPVGDAERFRSTVMGPTGRLPRPIESWTVAVLLLVAAALVAITAFAEEPGVVRLGAAVAAGVLALRGGGGLVVSGLIRRDGPFAHWDRRLYSPLCLTLAALMAISIAAI